MPGSVITRKGNHRQAGKASQYVASHQGQLSLAIPLEEDAISTDKSWDTNWHTAQCSTKHHIRGLAV